MCPMVWQNKQTKKNSNIEDKPLMLFVTLKVSAHWVRNFHTLKNKYDLKLCQSRLHTASETFIRQNNSDQVRFSAFSHPLHCMRKFRTQCAMALRMKIHFSHVICMLRFFLYIFAMSHHRTQCNFYLSTTHIYIKHNIAVDTISL